MASLLQEMPSQVISETPSSRKEMEVETLFTWEMACGFTAIVRDGKGDSVEDAVSPMSIVPPGEFCRNHTLHSHVPGIVSTQPQPKTVIPNDAYPISPLSLTRESITSPIQADSLALHSSVSDLHGLQANSQYAKSSTTADTVHQNTHNELSSNTNSDVQTSSSQTHHIPPTLLTLPLELRLKIYHQMLLTHPIHHAYIAPLHPPHSFAGMNTEEFHTIRLAPPANKNLVAVKNIICPSSEICLTPDVVERVKKHEEECRISAENDSNPDMNPSTKTSESSIPTTQKIKIQSPFERPKVQGKIPTALLQTCKQIYHESRSLPWSKNTFQFINWHWSGIYSAKAFLGSLEPWQREGVRGIGIEVLGREILVESPEAGKKVWTGVGAEEGEAGPILSSDSGSVSGEVGDGTAWSGVQTLPLQVIEKKKDGIETLWNSMSGVQHLSILIKGGFDLSGVKGLPNGLDGLRDLKELRWVEIEIEDKDLSRDSKITFCRRLETILNTPISPTSASQPPSRKIKILLREAIELKDKSKVKGEGEGWEGYVGGGGGDETDWEGYLESS